MGIPQIIFIIISSIGLLLAARDHGAPRPDSNFWLHLIATCITYILLIWGGFFK